MNPKEQPNVLIFVMDAVRYDYCTPYNSKRKTTPFLEDFSNEYITYTNAYSTSCWTLPSVASIFTGKYPCEHGVIRENDELDPSTKTLPELLNSSNYKTVGITANDWILDTDSLTSGFDQTINPLRESNSSSYLKKFKQYCLMEDESKTTILNSVKKIFQSTPSDKPIFMYTHLMESHTPYSFKNTSFLHSPLNYLKNLYINAKFHKKYYRSMYKRFYSGQMSLTNKELNQLNVLYKKSVKFVDTLLRQIIKILKETDSFENSLIFILSDHGENLGFNDHLTHRRCLFPSVTKIPFFLKPPESDPESTNIKDIVQSNDIFNTVLYFTDNDYVNKEPSSQLCPPLQNNRDEKRTYAFSEYFPLKSDQAFNLDPGIQNKFSYDLNSKIESINDKNYQYLRDEHNNKCLYKLSDNYKNKPVNVASENKQLVARYESAMDQFIGELDVRIDSTSAVNEVGEELEEEKIDRLKDLGYL